MALYKSTGIVVKRMNFGEADRILTIYTRNFGKVKAVAKGVRKVTSRKSGHLELFTISEMVFAAGKSLDVITDSSTVESLPSVRKSLFKTSLAYYVAELVDGFTEEAEKDAHLFDLIFETVVALNKARKIASGALIVRAFEVKMLGYLGYAPTLDKCAGCSATIVAGAGNFSVPDGGLVCPLCSTGKRGTVQLSSDAVKLLRFLRNADYGRISRIRIKNELLLEVEGVLRYFIKSLLDKGSAAHDFYEEVKQLQK